MLRPGRWSAWTLAAGEVVERQGVGCAPCKAWPWVRRPAAFSPAPRRGRRGQATGAPARRQARGGGAGGRKAASPREPGVRPIENRDTPNSRAHRHARRHAHQDTPPPSAPLGGKDTRPPARRQPPSQGGAGGVSAGLRSWRWRCRGRSPAPTATAQRCVVGMLRVDNRLPTAAHCVRVRGQALRATRLPTR